MMTEEVKKLVDAAKAQGHIVYAINIAGVKYYYRSINRFEFRELQAKLAEEAEAVKVEIDKKREGLEKGDPKLLVIEKELDNKVTDIKERGEERLLSKGLLYPKIDTNSPAGVLTTISDLIMQASGFGSESEPELL